MKRLMVDRSKWYDGDFGMLKKIEDFFYNVYSCPEPRRSTLYEQPGKFPLAASLIEEFEDLRIKNHEIFGLLNNG